MNRAMVRHSLGSIFVLAMSLTGCSGLSSPRPDIATAAATLPATAAPPATYRHDLRHEPNQSIHLITVDLADSRVRASVSRGGADPDGDGPWTTTLLPVREVAERERFDIAVNGDFFEAKPEKDAKGNSTGFVRNKWANPAGPAETDGKVWKPAPTTRPALLIGEGRAAVEAVNPKHPFPAWAKQAIGGNVILVRDGRAVTHTNADRHPRTVAGVDKAGTHLILMVVDGRQKDLSIGMTYAELAQEMLKAGAWNAVNLDGGGSTTLIMRDPASRKLMVVNSPSDRRERAVANVVGIRIEGPLPSTRPTK
jgi:hypothetical protein